ncbi:MAG: molybdate ABC transporter permease subunit, partial [Gordonia sp. (in: high G+C Gram-positive bacteria)]|nr:molybdate ABC transporter permease subunit [Gordonia sp. (in: high G+C Gram-positive bacteria)]
MSLPRALYIPAALGIAFLILPIIGLVSRVHWATLGDDLFSHASMTALRLSLVTAAAATVVCIVLGLPLAVVM